MQGCTCIFTARKLSLQRLCFYTCLSVHSVGVPGQVPPWTGTPPGQVHPPAQVHPLPWAGTPPPLGRYTPSPGRAGTPPPLGRYTPWAGTPPRQVHPRADISPQAGTPPWAGTPPRQVHPLGRHPQSSACWEIWATSGRYASYWNAFLCEGIALLQMIIHYATLVCNCFFFGKPMRKVCKF